MQKYVYTYKHHDGRTNEVPQTGSWQAVLGALPFHEAHKAVDNTRYQECFDDKGNQIEEGHYADLVSGRKVIGELHRTRA